MHFYRGVCSLCVSFCVLVTRIKGLGVRWGSLGRLEVKMSGYICFYAVVLDRDSCALLGGKKLNCLMGWLGSGEGGWLEGDCLYV